MHIEPGSQSLTFRVKFQCSLGKSQINGGVISRKRRKMKNCMPLFYMQSCSSFEVLGVFEERAEGKKMVGGEITNKAGFSSLYCCEVHFKNFGYYSE